MRCSAFRSQAALAGVVLACPLAFGCEVFSPEDIQVLPPDSVIRVTLDPDPATNTLMADGSILTIVVGLQAERGTEVEIRSSLGTFEGTDKKSTITLKADSLVIESDDEDDDSDDDEDSDSKADSVFAAARLNLGQKAGFLRLAVSVGEFTLRPDSIPVVHARPDIVQLVTSKVSVLIDGSDKVDLTAFLRRNGGKRVSEGIGVLFEAFQEQGGSDVSVGRFLVPQPGTSDAQGKVMNSFIADTLNAAAIKPDVKITLVATVLKPGTSDRDTIPPDSIRILPKTSPP